MAVFGGDAIAEDMRRSETLVDAYSETIKRLTDLGALAAANHLSNERRKELKRQRLACNESPDVAGALQASKLRKEMEDRKKQHAIRDANQKMQSLLDARKASEKATELLNKRKRELLALESVMEANHTLKRYDPVQLGQGKARCGGPSARKLRYEVMDRMCKLGSGLSSAQRLDWAWFHEAWDAKMATEHDINWGGVFSGWMQRVVDDIGLGITNAFSTFVESETRRCFSDTPLLVLPAPTP